jgi:dipeptidyl aminopeptidase/acylaminoacyl peptidase
VVVLAAIAGLTLPRWLSRSREPDAQSINIKQLTQSGDAGPVAISPDGRYVAYMRQTWQRTATLWLLQIATQTAVQIPGVEGPGTNGLTFSPDGNYLYIRRNDQRDPFSHHLFRLPTWLR